MLGLLLSSQTRLGLRASSSSSGTRRIFDSDATLTLTSFTVQDLPWNQEIRNNVSERMDTVDF